MWDDDSKTINLSQVKAIPPKACAREAEGESTADSHQGQQYSTVGEQMHDSTEITQLYPQRFASPNTKYQFSGRHDWQYHEHGLRKWACCQTSRHARMSRLGLVRMENPRQKQVTLLGGFPVLDLKVAGGCKHRPSWLCPQPSASLTLSTTNGHHNVVYNHRLP